MRAFPWATSFFVLLAGCSAADPSSTPGKESRSDASSESAKKDAGPDAAEPPPAPPDAVLLNLMPADVFSGVDGTHTFQVPVSVYGAKGVKLTASDPSVVTITPAKITDPAVSAGADDGEAFLLTMKKAGKVTLTAEVKGGKTTGSLTVVEYAANRWAAGEQRYKNASGSNPPCTQCHAGASAVDHSPTAIAAAPDQEVTATITTGVLRDQPIRGVNHRWQETTSVLDGLVTYLRSLPPKGYAPR